MPCPPRFQAVSEIIRTTLGPRSMLKMLLDPMGGIVMTNDVRAECSALHTTRVARSCRALALALIP